MRILIIPSLDDRKYLESAPDFKMSIELAKGLNQLGHFCYFVIPKKNAYGKEWIYNKEHLESILGEDIQFIELPMLKDQYQEALFTPELLELVVQSKCPYLYDVIINCCCGSSLNMKKLRSIGFGYCDVNIPIINLSYDLKVTGDNKTHILNEETEVNEINNLCWDFAAFTLPAERIRFMKHAKKYLSFSMLNKVNQNSTITHFPIDLERFKKLPRKKKNDEIVFLFAGRTTVVRKKFEESLNIYKKLVSSGRKNVRFMLTTPEKENPEVIKLCEGLPNCELHWEMNNETYPPLLSKADIFICLSTQDSAGITYWEMCAAGLIGLFKEGVWLKENGALVCNQTSNVQSRIR